MNSPVWIYCIGLLAQAFFTARVLVQWYLTEKNHRNESPSLFWMFSLAGSITLFIYGWLRNDFAIIAGEFFAYYIYLWNICTKGVFEGKYRIVPVLLAFTPPVCFSLLANSVADYSIFNLFSESNMPLWLLIFGLTGQIIFKTRFIYQFIYSYRRKESLMPINFWIIAICGSSIIIIYSLFRHDWVLFLGQFGIIPSVRNLLIARQNQNEKKNN